MLRHCNSMLPPRHIKYSVYAAYFSLRVTLRQRPKSHCIFRRSFRFRFSSPFDIFRLILFTRIRAITCHAASMFSLLLFSRFRHAFFADAAFALSRHAMPVRHYAADFADACY